MRRLSDDNWRFEAACRRVPNPDPIFFPNTRAKGGRDLKNQALSICATCPVKDPCLEEGLRLEANGKPSSGIWGGTTEIQRKRLLPDGPPRLDRDDDNNWPLPPTDICGSRKGTEPGYQAHRRAHEVPCDDCSRGARAAWEARRARKKKEKAA